MDSRRKQANMQKATLEEFEYSDYNAWRKTVETQLNGALFEKKLIRKSPEQIDIQPLYSKENSNINVNEMPGSFPFTRSSSSTPKAPYICQQISAATPRQLNKILQHNVGQGQNGIYLYFDQTSRAGSVPQKADDIGSDGVAIANSGDFESALAGLDLSQLYLHIDTGIAGSPALALLSAALEKLNIKTNELKGAVLCDPHRQLMSEGFLNMPVEEIYSDLAAMLKLRAKLFPNCAMIGVDVRIIRESGGSAREELAVALASAVEYMRALAKHNFEMNDIAPAFLFSMASGSDFFMEIAKLRAARRLWAQIVTSCEGDADKAPFKVNVSGQHWNKTIYDPYVNMLRTTTESFAAMLGGADSLNSVAFDEVFSTPDEFSRRVARNTQIILNEESHATEVIDPAGGSWYIEKLTDELAKNAWQLFCTIEKQGGFLKALQNGFIQNTILQTSSLKKERIAQRKDGIIGTSLFVNLNEKIPGKRNSHNEADKEVHFAEIKSSLKKRDQKSVQAALNQVDKKGDSFNALVNAARAGATLQELHQAVFSERPGLKIEPLRKIRAAENYELLRRASEKYKEKNGDYPVVVLATMGPVFQHRTRADFTGNFITPAGFRPVESGVESDISKVLETVKKNKAKAVVICSTDETYAGCVPPLAAALKNYDNSLLVLVAGNPVEIRDMLSASGVDDFLHIKSNNLEFLQMLQLKTGVT